MKYLKLLILSILTLTVTIVDAENQPTESLPTENRLDSLDYSLDAALLSFEGDTTFSFAKDTILAFEKDSAAQRFAYSMTDTLLLDYYLKNAYQTECSLIDSTSYVFCSDSLYMSRLQSLPYVVEMPFNSIVKRYIETYAKRPKSVGYMLGIGRTLYFPIFEAALERHGVPLELCYLPVIESALNPRATSPVGAAGLWQFMVYTGRVYGLEVNSLVDERRDPIKSSEAAAKYLASLYDIYGDWLLVIAAYNCGPGNVAKAIRHSGGKRDYWSIYPYLPSETRGYVPIFIAANYIMNFYKEHNICPAEPKVVFTTDTVMVRDRVHLQQIADVTGINIETLRFHNPQYRHDIIPGNIKPYPLTLPMSHADDYVIHRDSILRYKPELAARQIKADPDGYQPGSVVYYKVKNGDTLGGIAAKYRVKVSQLKRWNGISGTMIRAGQRLKIYR